MPGGQGKVRVPEEKVGLRLPKGLHDEMVRVIESAREWKDRQHFIAEAIREKIERWKREHPLGPPARR